jgi:hypothetical protein
VPVKKLTVDLVNNLGQVVKNRIICSPAIDHIEKISSSGLKRGVYFVRIISEKWQKTEKVILQ